MGLASYSLMTTSSQNAVKLGVHSTCVTVAFVSARMALYPASPPVLCMKYYCTNSTGIIKDSCRTQRLVVKIVLGASGTRIFDQFDQFQLFLIVRRFTHVCLGFGSRQNLHHCKLNTFSVLNCFSRPVHIVTSCGIV